MTTCEFMRCSSPAVFGYEDDSAPHYCDRHKDDGMKSFTPSPQCQFAKCEAVAIYGFPDDMIPLYCSQHTAEGLVKTDGKVEALGEGPAPTKAPVSTIKSQATSPQEKRLLEEYAGLEAELMAMGDAIGQHKNIKQELGVLHTEVHQRKSALAHLQKEVSDLETRIARQEKKPNLGGKSLFGRGLLVQDADKVHKLEAEKEAKAAQVAEFEAELSSKQQEVDKLREQDAASASRAHQQGTKEARMRQIFQMVMEMEQTPVSLLDARARRENNRRLQGELDYVHNEVKKAEGHFGMALQLQAQAQRRNAGAIIGDGAGERAFQAMRDASTQRSIKEAQNAADMLEEAFKSVPPELHEMYPDLMREVGRVPIPDLYRGRFGRAVVAGAVFGDVGDAVNQTRSAVKIQKNKQEVMRCLEICKSQRQMMAVVKAQMVRSLLDIEAEVKKEKIALFDSARQRDTTEKPSAAISKPADVEAEIPVATEVATEG